MKALIPAVISSVATIVGVALGFCLAPLTERRVRRRRFHDQIVELLVELENTKDDGEAFYTSYRHIVLVECAKVKNDILCCKQSRFNTACTTYRDLAKNEAKRGVQDMVAINYPSPEHPPSPKDGRSVKQKIIDVLQELIDCAK